jgi:hypothetical protein
VPHPRADLDRLVVPSNHGTAEILLASTVEAPLRHGSAGLGRTRSAARRSLFCACERACAGGPDRAICAMQVGRGAAVLCVLIAGCGSAPLQSEPSPEPVSSSAASSPSDTSAVASESSLPPTSTTVNSWVPKMPAPSTPLTVDEVPMLLPQPLPIANPLEVGRSDDDPGESATQLQIYGSRTGTDWLHVETTAPSGALTSGESIGPWTATTSSIGGEHTLVLTASNVVVTLWSNVVNTDEMKTIAAQIRPGTASAWDLGTLPSGLELVAQGTAENWVARRVTQIDPTRGFVLALEVLPDNPAMASTYFNPSAQLIGFDGKRAIYFEQTQTPGHISTLVWEYAPRVFVRLGALDSTPDEMLQMARSIYNATIEEWEALDTVTDDGDGCPSFWC